VLYGDNEFAKAVALAAGLPYCSLPENIHKVLAGPHQKIMLISHQLKLALAEGDLLLWKSRVLELEQSLFLPLLLALKNKVIDSIIIDFTSGINYAISRRNLKKWWKSPASLKKRLSEI
jgi:hypothetical protein